MRRAVIAAVCAVLAAAGLVTVTAPPSAALQAWVALDEGFEYGLGAWGTTHTGGNQPDWYRAGDPGGSGSFAAHVVGAGSAADQFLTTPPMALGDEPYLSFLQRYDFEFSDSTAWDGGVLEYSTDDGTTWQDLSDIASVAYTGTVTDTSDNPIGGRPAFTGTQSAYGRVKVDIAALAHQTVQLRFRLGADAAQSSGGWWVDDVRVDEILDSAPPVAAAPTDVAVTALSSSKVAVTFTPSAGGGTSPVVAHIATCTSPGGALGTSATRQAEVEVAGLTPGASYQCQVQAWTADGVGDWSSPVGVVPGAAAPGAGNTAVPAATGRGRGVASYDALAASPAEVSPSANQRAALGRLVRPGTVPQLQDQLGVPTTLFAARPGPVAAPGAGERPAVAAARGHLARLAPVYGLSDADVAAAQVVGEQRRGQGAAVVQLGSSVRGVEVWHERLSLVMRHDLGLVGASGYLLPRTVEQGRFALDARAATAAAYADLTGRQPSGLSATGSRGGYTLLTSPDLAGEARAKQVFYRLPDGLVAGWYVEVSVPRGGSSRLVGYVVAADDGRVLSRTELGADDNLPVDYRVWADGSAGGLPFDSPYGTAGSPDPSGLPDGHVEPYVAPELLQGPLTGDPWLSSGSVTTGNNVDAYVDLVAPDGFSGGDFRADTTSANTFDRTFDVAQAPSASTEQGKAALTQLFYDVNYLHDWFYGSGFDEAAGNAQQDNYGRGGLGGDRILAEDQDYSGKDNANMLTPADGASPVMQMYVWGGPVIQTLTVTGIGDVAASPAAYGPTDYDLSATIRAATDGQGASSTDGCETITSSVTGAIALVDRGNCSFVVKTQNAQAAGAVGLLIANNTTGSFGIAGSCGGCTIPTAGVTQADGATIRAAAPVTGHMTRQQEPDRDGALDHTIVSHEWGHYLSGRLVPGLSSQQAGAMGEGWSDFVSLLMLVRAEDVAKLDGAYATGTYAAGALSGSPFYFGIRRAPYSTDLTKNPFTFRHIGSLETLPSTAPLNVLNPQNNEVHNAGEIWAEMLWECYAALLGDTTGPSPRLTFDQAKRRMSDYLVASLRATPPNPTYLEARDALLLTAYAGDPADYDLFLAAFAKRGAGTAAVGPARSSTSLDGVVESYSTEPVPTSVSIDLSEVSGPTQGWYRDIPHVTVTGTGGGGGLELRCVLDDPTHASYAELMDDPREPCDYAEAASAPQGVHTFYAAARETVGGATTPVVSRTVKVDSGRPNVPELRSFDPATTSSSLTLRFPTVDALSGVASYDVQVRSASYQADGLPTSPSYAPGGKNLSASKLTVKLKPGTTYCFRVRATDVAGNNSRWSWQSCTVRLLDDTALAHSKGWSTDQGTGYLGGSASRATSKGRSLSLGNAHGRWIAVRAVICPSCGSVNVLVGSKKLGTLSLKSASKKTTILQIGKARGFSGTVRLVTTSGKQVIIDGLAPAHA